MVMSADYNSFARKMAYLSYNEVVSGNLFKRATSPRQYDSPIVGWTADSKGTSLPIREFILEYLAPHISGWKGKDLLEIGLGTGWLLDIAYKAGVCSATGIDPSKRSISLAQKYYPQITSIDVAFEKYVPDKNFDVVLSVLSFGHISNLEAAFKKISQLLKKEGEIFLIVGDYDYYKRQRYGY